MRARRVHIPESAIAILRERVSRDLSYYHRLSNKMDACGVSFNARELWQQTCKVHSELLQLYHRFADVQGQPDPNPLPPRIGPDPNLPPAA